MSGPCVPIKPLGKFLVSCKHWLKRDPAIGEAWSCYRHWDKGQLQLLYPNRIPILLLRAIEGLDAGFNVGQSDKFKSK